MFKRGSRLNADGLNKLIKDSNKRIRVTGGGKFYPKNNVYENDILVTGGKRGGGGIVIKYVAKLPVIQNTWKTPKFVYWCDEQTGLQLLGEEGTGDNQVWVWWPHSAYYVPMQKYTVLSGIPEGQNP